MNTMTSRANVRRIAIAAVLSMLPLVGCGPSYRTLRHEGMSTMATGSYGSAKWFFLQADQKKPRQVDNLYDLATCYLMLAKDDFQQQYYAAAMRDVNNAIDFFGRAIDAHPGHQPAIEGKSMALELKGQFDAALANAEWAAEFVGPAAAQFLFLAKGLEARGQLDDAFLRYRQAVAVEPKNVEAHLAFARFLLKGDNEAAAVHHLQEAYLIDPTDTWTTDQLARRGALPYLTSERDPNP